MEIVGYHEMKDKRTGERYFKGEDGTICLPHPADPRISRAVKVNQVSMIGSTQLCINEFKGLRK